MRPARPQDAGAYARYLDMAAHGFFTSLFGSRAEQIVAEISEHPGHELSLDNVVVAEVQGRVVGSCAGGMDGEVPTGLIIRAAGWRAARAAVVFAASFPTGAWLTRRTPGEWYLQSIAVDADLRGAGVGSALFDDAVRRARAAGASRMVLDVETTNDTARRLYEQMGMTIVDTSPAQRLPGVPRVHRMALQL